MSQAIKPSSAANRALLRAFRSWGMGDFERASKRFAPAWREHLQACWDPEGHVTAGEAWDELRREHKASARPDPDRVHPSWFVRALRGESETVKYAITAHAKPSMQPWLIEGLEIDPDRLTPVHPPDPEAIAWAMSLWAERLVGALPETDDPAIIVAITRLSSLDLAKLIKVCGVAKHAFAIDGARASAIDEQLARFSPLDRVRLGYFRRRIGIPDARLAPLAKQDLSYIEDDRKRAHLRLGLVTVGRLLEAAEIGRARWAVQHLPYSVAKLVRRKMALPMPKRAVVAWENWILEAAWSRLLSERRMTGGRDWLPDDLEEEEEEES